MQRSAPPEGDLTTDRRAPEGVSAGASKTVSHVGEPRVARIESLRALAALAVVWAHAFGGSGGDVVGGFDDRLMAGIGFAAFFFFALSGALLYMPFARRDFGDGSPIRLGGYGLNRVVRVFPLYYFALVAVFLTGVAGATQENFWRFALFLQNFSEETVGRVNGVLWTVVVELHFYLTLPLLAYLLARLARRSVKRALVVLGGLALASVTAQVILVLIPQIPFPDPLAFSYPLNFYFFAAGMAVPLVRESWTREGRPAWLRGRLASRDAWLLAAVPFWLIFVWSYQLEPVFSIGCFLVLGACLLPLERGRAIQALDWRPLALLGLVSYSLYIWHVPVARAITSEGFPVLEPLIGFLEGATGSPFIALLVVLVPAACAVAAVSYVLIESPPLRLRRRWGGGRRQSLDRAEAAPQPAASSPPS